jgi:hypothetical protein
MPDLVALSVKQPWAALIVAGLKTVEVRTWPTRRRGRVLIHAGKLADDRPHGWARVATPELMEATRLRGGIVGVAELAACRCYETAEAFAADEPAHLNAPDWFVPPRLYGFVFRDVRSVGYHPCPGQTMFFGVEGFDGLPVVTGGVDRTAPAADLLTKGRRQS